MPNRTKFELSMLENQLETVLKPENIEQTLKSKNKEQVQLEIELESCRICHELRDTTCRNLEEHHLERYIQMHQQGAARLLDKAYAFLQTEPMADCADCREVYTSAMNALERILNFIEKEQGRYFDLRLPVPDSFRIASAKQLLDDRNVLNAKMRSKDINPLLQQLILDYMAMHCSLQSCSYLEQKHAKLLSERLLKVLKSNNAKDWNRKVIVELIYLNFNKSTFFTWCRKEIAGDIDGFKTVKEQSLRFNWYLKEIKALDAKPNVAYKYDRQAIKELLSHYIAGELVYLAECHQQQGAEPVLNFKERAEKFDFKLPLSLTVPQLRFIVQLFIDVGVFKVEYGQIFTVMKFFADHVSTTGAEHMSAESLYKKPAKPNAKVRDEVEQVLKDMAERLQVY